MTMTATDYDDPNEGTNAKLTYSIEKNVIDEEQNRPIFEIEPETGVIKVSICKNVILSTAIMKPGVIDDIF